MKCACGNEQGKALVKPAPISFYDSKSKKLIEILFMGPALVGGEPPDQREAVRMDARRGQAEDHVAGRDPSPVSASPRSTAPTQKPARS